ncbi:MAG TPA: hypothetical protein VN363_09995 [Anaerolineales bacterium]|nr:hypothetical protein [Anaerolineales bacterium]
MAKSGKWLLIRVTDLQTGEKKTNVRIPVSLANFGIKMANKYAPESLEGLDMDEIMAALREGDEGILVDVEDEQSGDHVEILVE